MAKKLIYNYEFDASAKTIKIGGNYTVRKLILITNTTDGEIIYNFAEPSAGATVYYDSFTDKTTITLEYDTTSMSDGDELQILADDAGDTKIDAGESLIDPVHKFRVSNPQNLIDTDFEYGLQPTKWETVELVDNIASVYTRDSGVSIGLISNITTILGTDNVTVTTGLNHDLGVGDPIEVQGTSSRTANGKYVVTAVANDFEFIYRASGVQNATRSIKTAYSTIIPGSFFAGSDIRYSEEEGIATNGASPNSTLTITTNYKHGIIANTSVYIRNTVGKRTFAIADVAATQADGATGINPTENTIYIEDHNLYAGQELIIQPGTGGTLPSLPAALIGPRDGDAGIQAVYDKTKAYMEAFNTTLSGVSRNAVVLTHNVSTTQMGWITTNYKTFSFEGSTYRQRIWYYDGLIQYNGQHYIYLRKKISTNSSNYMAQYQWNWSGSWSTNYTGSPVNIANYYTRARVYSSGGSQYQWPTRLSNMGLRTDGNGDGTVSGGFSCIKFCATPVVHNVQEPFLIDVMQYDLTKLRPPTDSSNNYGVDAWSQQDGRYRNKASSHSSYYRYRDYTSKSPVMTYDSNGWKYAYHMTEWQPYSAGYLGYVKFDLGIWNENWPGYSLAASAAPSTTWNSNNWTGYYVNSTYNLMAVWTGVNGPWWQIGILIPYRGAQSTSIINRNDHTQTGTTVASQSIITAGKFIKDLLDTMIPNLANPQWGNATGANAVNAIVVNKDRIKIANGARGTEFKFNDTGSGPVNISTLQIAGVVDNYYPVTSTTDTTLNISASATIEPRLLEFTNVEVITYESDYYIRVVGGHACMLGQKGTFTVGSGAAIPGLTSGTVYYVIPIDNEYLQLASDYTNAVGRVNEITGLPASAGSYSLSVSAINGTVSAPGAVTISENSNVVDGSNTRFSSTYKIGDNFAIVTGEDTVKQFESRKIVSIVGDTQLALDNPVGVAVTDVPHYVDTTVNVRADGTFLHRPFDGGVEITAGKSPDSTIVRQTRKYFRYQSGKGIQCSMAINFNPARPAKLATGSGAAITLTTEYPHGLTAGDTVTVSGAEEHRQITPTSASYDPTTGLLTVTLSNHGILQGEEVFFAEGAFTLQCAYDGYATDHPYPRSTDPAGRETRLTVKSVTSSTFVVDVGTSTNTSAHNVTSIATNGVTHVDTSNAYNGTHTVTAATDFTFSYTSSSNVSVAQAKGFVDYVISGYKNAGIRAGLFDFQNGFFFEYDGKDLACVRRSSVQQLAGTVDCSNGSNVIGGTDTSFQDQLKVRDLIVVRGQTYKVTSVESQTEIHIQPSYRGTSTVGAVATKTVDTKARQKDWNIDKADGTGPSGYILDINKIQMAYMDYSWYGAGKIRFGFKDTYGHVKYMHEFIHNNKLNEAYMRSGNVPARYEVFNTGLPTYVPSLFHWGTSVIMDGGFDDDDSYLFTASGNTLTFTNGDADTATTGANGTVTSTRVSWRIRNYYLRLSFPSTDAGKFSTGIGLWTDDGALNGETVAYTGYGSGVFYVYIFLSQGYTAPGGYPIVANNTVVNIGAPAVGATGVDLTSNIPLISVRLAPSADNNLIGELGERDIVNRMQLKMQELGISVSHDAKISVILNGSLNNLTYANVGTPSLSQYIAHDPGDTVQDGTEIYSFRASGGSEDANGKRLTASSAFDLSTLTDLGNSILGGDGVFPNGPDIITIAASVINTAEIDKTSSFQVASRISWAESQA